MATTRASVQTPGRRQRSENKRAAILSAAEALFVSEGYELTSVDAIATRAGVSKRTLYDHFGDKQTLFQVVLTRVTDTLAATVRTAIEQELTEGRDLREGLMAFASRVATEAFPSSEYVTFRRLTSQDRSAPRLPEAVRERPERMLEERFAQLAANGEIRTADPRRAAQHFTALTVLLAVDALRDEPAGAVEESEILAIITDGVDAFLRAYR
ncbi:TetR/AcrR family transcriptional regulator [Streptomyces acidicola]|uniref:TetR/AcrR family transcriptional regulator n=1 Tax=Streptomyces acidicola TaxID=2596892 RepID=A0A5N8X1J3_9ACTN|nr:TetR/AcrR family transcriptional regulator [Streptomyces acidicola]MPY53409.1 TetR/AcrR family transcriptional regulator [Streptomyces acidicola]